VLHFQGVPSKFEVSTDADVPGLTVSPASGSLELTGLSAKTALTFEKSPGFTPEASPSVFNVNCKVRCLTCHASSYLPWLGSMEYLSTFACLHAPSPKPVCACAFPGVLLPTRRCVFIPSHFLQGASGL